MSHRNQERPLNVVSLKERLLKSSMSIGSIVAASVLVVGCAPENNTDRRNDSEISGEFFDPKYTIEKKADMQNINQSIAGQLENLTNQQRFDDAVMDSLEQGPQPGDTILGEFEVGQDRTIGNAIMQESNEAGHPLDLTKYEDRVTITLSAYKIADEYEKKGRSTQPNDIFVIYEQDVDKDGDKEALAVPVSKD